MLAPICLSATWIPRLMRNFFMIRLGRFLFWVILRCDLNIKCIWRHSTNAKDYARSGYGQLKGLSSARTIRKLNIIKRVSPSSTTLHSMQPMRQWRQWTGSTCAIGQSQSALHLKKTARASVTEALPSGYWRRRTRCRHRIDLIRCLPIRRIWTIQWWTCKEQWW